MDWALDAEINDGGRLEAEPDPEKRDIASIVMNEPDPTPEQERAEARHQEVIRRVRENPDMPDDELSRLVQWAKTGGARQYRKGEIE